MQRPSDELDSLVDFPQIAGFYSQLSGVLAGFVFTSLIGLIGAQIATTRRTINLTLRSYRPLIAAFLGLVATSLNYAIIGGEESKTERVAQLEVTAGLGFCVAGTMALYSILVLLRGVEADLSNDGVKSGHTADLLRGTLVFGICPLLLVLMWGAQRDHLAMKYGPSGYYGLDFAYLISFLLTIAISAIMPRFLFKRRTNSGRLIELISRTAVTIAIVSLFASTLTISLTTRESMRSDYVHLTFLVILTIFVWATMWSSATYHPIGHHPAGSAANHTHTVAISDVKSADSSNTVDPTVRLTTGAAVAALTVGWIWVIVRQLRKT